MSLAHLMVPKVARPRKSAGAADKAAAGPDKAAAGGGAYCGASREPVYRTLDQAGDSGLEICTICLIGSRKQRKAV
jgi:hypothetical protein